MEKSREIREKRKSTIFRLCYTKVVKTPIKRCVNNVFLFIFTQADSEVRLQVSERYLNLNSVKNARELGGIPLSGGRIVRKGLLIRAGRLSELSSEDRIALSQQWKLTEIIDLRNSAEIAEHPNQTIPGVTTHVVPIFPNGEVGVTREDHGMDMIDLCICVANKYRNGGARRLLEGLYPKMACNESCLKGIRHFFDILLDHRYGAVLWHCTSGKDRTGVTAALLLLALGASWETVLEDYLQTNIQTQQQREALCQGMADRNVAPELIEEIRTIESVDPVYLETCRHLIEEKYGSMDQFFVQALGLTEEKRIRLQRKYTCQATL